MKKEDVKPGRELQYRGNGNNWYDAVVLSVTHFRTGESSCIVEFAGAHRANVASVAYDECLRDRERGTLPPHIPIHTKVGVFWQDKWLYWAEVKAIERYKDDLIRHLICLPKGKIMKNKKPAKDLEDAELQQDEMVLAAIIAGQESSGYQVARGQWIHTPTHGSPVACACAVGMGLLFCGVKTAQEAFDAPDYSPTYALAKRLGVSYRYADGLSDGFENGWGPERESSTWDEDYKRGARLGAIVAEVYGLAAP